MTPLHKPLTRKTLRSEWGTGVGKKLVVMLEPGDIIAIKIEKTRTWKRICIHTLFWQLCQRDADELRKAKQKSRRGKQ